MVSLFSDGVMVIFALGTIKEIMNRRIHNINKISRKKIRINKYLLLSYVCR
jgi:hypothetical protein